MVHRDSWNDWYDQNSGVSAPIPEQPARQPFSAGEDTAAQNQAKGKPRRRRHPGMKAGTLVVCALILIVASVYAFSDRSNLREAAPEASSSADSGQDYASDFRKFFEEYYISSSSTPQHSGSLVKRTSGDPERSVELASAAGREELTLGEIYDRGVGSITGIKSSTEGQKGYFWGSGIIMSEDGYILTNQHIIDETDHVLVVLPDGRELEGLLVGEDIPTDLAVLKIEAEGLQPAEFGDSAAMHVGDRVAAIGNPLGDDLACTLTDGIISGFRNDLYISGQYRSLLQTNAAINVGSSGSPLFNMYGQVVGVVNMKMVNPYSTTTVEGLGFAIPSTVVKSVGDQLIARGKVTGRPVIGVTLGAIPQEAAEHYQLPEGLYVHSVTAGSDAMAQGIREGDILTHVDGKPVTSTEEVLEIRNRHNVGEQLVLSIWRDGKTSEIAVTLRDQNQIS